MGNLSDVVTTRGLGGLSPTKPDPSSRPYDMAFSANCRSVVKLMHECVTGRTSSTRTPHGLSAASIHCTFWFWFDGASLPLRKSRLMKLRMRRRLELFSVICRVASPSNVPSFYRIVSRASGRMRLPSQSVHISPTDGIAADTAESKLKPLSAGGLIRELRQ